MNKYSHVAKLVIPIQNKSVHLSSFGSPFKPFAKCGNKIRIKVIIMYIFILTCYKMLNGGGEKYGCCFASCLESLTFVKKIKRNFREYHDNTRASAGTAS